MRDGVADETETVWTGGEATRAEGIGTMAATGKKRSTMQLPKWQVWATASDRKPCVVVTVGDFAGALFVLEPGSTLVGRGRQCDIVLDDEQVSRVHCRFVVDGQAVVLEDLDSTNGVRVDGSAGTRFALHPGSHIALGTRTALRFGYHAPAEVEQQRQLYEASIRDALTGVHNRRYLTLQVQSELNNLHDGDDTMALVMLDIDHFKRINDTYGHPAGDHVLTQVARALAESVRGEDVVGRVGGEEFAVLLREADQRAAWACAERVRRMVEATDFAAIGDRVRVTVSLGYAVARGGDGSTVASLVGAADRQLYAAKQGGRNRVEPALGDRGTRTATGRTRRRTSPSGIQTALPPRPLEEAASAVH